MKPSNQEQPNLQETADRSYRVDVAVYNIDLAYNFVESIAQAAKEKLAKPYNMVENLARPKTVKTLSEDMTRKITDEAMDKSQIEAQHMQHLEWEAKRQATRTQDHELNS